jgi:hypothetical protein
MRGIACVAEMGWAGACAAIVRARLVGCRARGLKAGGSEAAESEAAALRRHQAGAYSSVGQVHVANLVVFRQYAAKAASLAAAAAAVWLAYDPRAVYLTRRMRGATIDVYA